MNDHTQILNKLLAHPEIRALLPRAAGYRFWKIRGSEDQYFYTTEKVNRKGKLRFISGIYRYVKTKKQWKAIMMAGHAKKKDAIARAYQMYKDKK